MKFHESKLKTAAPALWFSPPLRSFLLQLLPLLCRQHGARRQPGMHAFLLHLRAQFAHFFDFRVYGACIYFVRSKQFLQLHARKIEIRSDFYAVFVCLCLNVLQIFCLLIRQVEFVLQPEPVAGPPAADESSGAVVHPALHHEQRARTLRAPARRPLRRILLCHCRREEK